LRGRAQLARVLSAAVLSSRRVARMPRRGIPAAAQQTLGGGHPADRFVALDDLATIGSFLEEVGPPADAHVLALAGAPTDSRLGSLSAGVPRAAGAVSQVHAVGYAAVLAVRTGFYDRRTASLIVAACPTPALSSKLSPSRRSPPRCSVGNAEPRNLGPSVTPGRGRPSPSGEAAFRSRHKMWPADVRSGSLALGGKGGRWRG
jgi:hypothetical protein